MEGILWYLLASTWGSANRVRIIRKLEARPRNVNQLATELDLDDKTVKHHLYVLVENNVLERTDDDHAAVYLFTDQVKSHWNLIDDILETFAYVVEVPKEYREQIRAEWREVI